MTTVLTKKILLTLSLLGMLASCSDDIALSPEDLTATDTTTPAIVGAISTSNTTIYVSFSKSMGDSAADSSNYVITQENINPEVGTLIINAAYFPQGDTEQTSVVLETSPQNEVTYRIKGSGIKDADGTPLPGIIETLGGIVDTTSVIFAGSAPGLIEITVSEDGIGGISGWIDVNGNGLVDTGDSILGSNGSNIVLSDTDADDVIDNWVDADNSNSVTIGDTVAGFQDSDGDGLSDHVELYGRNITIEEANGEVRVVSVTSSPVAADTDGDGLSDRDELIYGSNPRNSDTDSDGLNDYQELNAIYSSPYKADTDGDSLEDGLEFNALQTSPIHADTDGDQLADNVELFERYRNPRIADLPKLSLVPGNHTIVLNEVFTYTDASGNEVAIESSSSAQLGTGSSEEILDIDETVIEKMVSGGAKGWIRGGHSDQSNASLFVQGGGELWVEAGFQETTSTGTDTTKTIESQRVLEESYSKGNVLSTSSEVTRTVESVTLNIELSLRNKGDIAFSVTDIEVTMLRLRPGTRELEPLATLISQSGGDSVYNLGPFDGEIGPLVFSAIDFPVGLAEELLRDPAGIAFRVANYEIIDEFGRQFTYINQEVKDVTAGLVVDYGFEGVDRFQMAASGLKDLNTGEALGMFDALGRPTGLPLTYLLQSQLGWERNPTTADAIIAGVDGVAQTAALGDDIQRVAVGTRGLGIGEVIIEAGPNGSLDSTIDPDSSNTEAVTRGFDTSFTCGVDAPVIFQGRKACSAASECTCTVANGCPVEILPDAEPGNEGFVNAQCDGPQIITRVGGYENKAGSYRWIALTNTDVTTSSDVDSIVMKPGESFKLAFVQDLDEDGLFGREEFLAGTTDSPVNQEDNVAFGDTYRLPVAGEANVCDFQVLPEFCGEEANQSVRIPLADSRDTDRDGMEDAVELELGWQVAANGQARRQVYSSPTLRDSDGDGLSDWQERDIRFSCAQQFYVAGEDRQVDGDYFGPLRLGEFAFNENTIVAYPALYENQRLVYSDPFVAADSPAETLIADDLISQVMDYVDNNNLLYINKVAPYCQPDVLDPTTADANDYISRAVALDPQNADTDGDGIEDGVELMGYDVNLAVVAAIDFASVIEAPDTINFSVLGDDILLREFSTTIAQGDVIILPGPNGQLDADYASLYILDTNFSANVEVLSERLPQRIRSNPLDFDTDDDLLSDGAERALGTNPVLAGDVGDLKDSDGDGVFDIDESRGLMIQVNGASFVVRSNPARSDTDGDGLPDFVEYQVGSNPSNADTDGDELSDYDEFSTGQFAQYAVYVDRFDNFVLDASTSRKYGTLLNDSDSDNDGLSDSEEVTGFSLITLQDGMPLALFVQTSPFSNDTDGDGLEDKYELETVVHFGTPDKMTNPVVADSDGDGIDDGREATNITDPLTPDRRVTVTYYELSLFDSSEIQSDWDWELRIQDPGASSPGTVVNTDETSNVSGGCPGCTETAYTAYTSPLTGGSFTTIPTAYAVVDLDINPALDNTSMSFLMSVDQYFSLSGIVLQYDGSGSFSCVSEFTKTFGYDDISTQSQVNGESNISENTCRVNVRYTIRTSN